MVIGFDGDLIGFDVDEGEYVGFDVGFDVDVRFDGWGWRRWRWTVEVDGWGWRRWTWMVEVDGWEVGGWRLSVGRLKVNMCVCFLPYFFLEIMNRFYLFFVYVISIFAPQV